VRTLLKDSLSSLGYNVMIASSGDEAVEIFEECFEVIDLAIIDMIMNDKNGKQTLKEIRKIKPGQRAIMSTTSSAKGEELKAIKRGGEAEFLKKPFRFSELSTAVQKLLNS